MDTVTIEAMKAVLKIQGEDGTWNYDEYMFGMYNGMELMIAIAENREPVFKEAPDEWLADKELIFTETKQGYIIQPETVKLKVLPGGKLKED